MLWVGKMYCYHCSPLNCPVFQVIVKATRGDVQNLLLLHLGNPSGKNRPRGPKNDDSTPEPHRELTNMGYGLTGNTSGVCPECGEAI
jgi:hypothetical protein